MRVLGLVWFGSVWVLWSLFGNYSSYQSWIILSNVLLIVLLFLLYLLNFFNTLYSDYGFPPKSSHWNPDSFFLCVIRKQISTSSSAGFPELWGERFDSDTLIVCAHCPVVGLCICSICIHATLNRSHLYAVRGFTAEMHAKLFHFVVSVFSPGKYVFICHSSALLLMSLWTPSYHTSPTVSDFLLRIPRQNLGA